MKKMIYELHEDAAAIASMQRGSVNADSVGLKITHGLIGSEEWWSKLKDGSLPVQIREGAVSGFWPGHHADGPAEFQLKEQDGTLSMWLCELEPAEARRAFQIGRSVRVEFVVQKLKVAFNGSDETKVVVSLSVEEAQQGHAGDVRNARA